MSGDWTWGGVFTAFLGILQWVIAIGSVIGTLALFTWIMRMFLKSDKAK